MNDRPPADFPACDVAVVGSGAAGLAAAVSAARAGCTTRLIDPRAGPGGTAGFSGLTTLCGLFDEAGDWLNGGFSREFAEALAEGPPVRQERVWLLSYQPERFRSRAAEFLAATPGLTVHWGTPLDRVRVEDGHIVQLNDFPVRAVIDCSGTAEVARLAGSACLATDETTQAPAVIFPLHGVHHDCSSPLANLRLLLPLARAGLPPLHLQPGRELDTVTAKFSGPPAQVEEVITVLRREVTGFAHCSSPSREFHFTPRAGRMILGRHVLSGSDILTARKFPDGVVRGAWPVEQWNAAGQCRLRYLPAGAYYDIPAQSLRATEPGNLFMAGKTISADVDAIASARVMGCCLATGAAAGQLAAAWVRSGADSPGTPIAR